MLEKTWKGVWEVAGINVPETDTEIRYKGETDRITFLTAATQRLQMRFMGKYRVSGMRTPIYLSPKGAFVGMFVDEDGTERFARLGPRTEAGLLSPSSRVRITCIGDYTGGDNHEKVVEYLY